MASSEATISQIYHVVLPLLLRAAQILMARQKELSGLSPKARHERGQAIEEEIKSFLGSTLIQLFPKHSIYDAERPVRGETAAWQWIVAPLDGGRYYFRGLPLFTTSLALKHQGEIVLGIIIEPATQAVFYALKGDGSFMGDRSLKVSDEKGMANGCVYMEEAKTTRRTNETSIRQRFIKEGCRLHDFGVSTLGLCYLAAGVFDAFIGFRSTSSLASLAAALLVAKEAGASVSDGEGKVLQAKSESNIIVVVCPGIKKQCLEIVQKR